MRPRRKKHPVITLLLAAVCAAILCFAALVIYVTVQENGVPTTPEEAAPYEAIIVLGAQVLPDGTPNVQLQWRLDAAAAAWKAHPVPVVVCGAQGDNEPEPEAVVMRRTLLAQGVPEEDLLMDPDSFNTRENLRNAARMLEEAGKSGPVLIVTSRYHAPRAVALARDCGLAASALGSPIKPEYWIKNHFREALAWLKYWAQKITGA